MGLTPVDWALIITYLVASLLVGLWYARRSSASTGEYFTSGRSLGWLLAGTSMVATTFAADTPLAVTELVRTRGVAGNWLWWNFVASGMLTVFLFARLWRRAEVLTDVELAEVRYGGKPAAILRVFRALYLAVPINAVIIGWVTTAMASVAMTTLGVGPGNKLLVIFILMIVTAAAAVAGGLWAVVVTDAFQFVLAMLGAIVLAVFTVRAPEVGGLSGLSEKLSARGLLDFFPHDAVWMPVTAFLVYVGVQWWATWYPGSEPGGGGYIAQRMFATKDEKNAVLATLWFNVAHYALRPWPWILVALASMVVLPQAPLNALTGAPDDKSAYTLMMLRYLPGGFRGLMLVSFFAAYMSTLSTQLNWGSSYLVNDVYRRVIKRDADERHYVRVSQLLTVATLLLGGAVAMLMERVTGGWELVLAIGAGTGPVYMLRWYWSRINAWSEVSAMLASLILAVALKGWFSVPAPYDLLVVGGVSSVCWLTVTLLTKPESDATLEAFFRRVHPAGPGWTRIAKRLPDVAPDQHLVRSLLDAAAGVGLVLGALFGVGSLLFSHFLAAAGWAVLAALCGAWISRSLSARA